MQLKKEFFELSKYFNKGTNEDKLLFIGMFLNFYLTENNFKNQEEIESFTKGTVINFYRDSIVITHRIVDIKKDEAGNIKFITKGDNNFSIDDDEVEISEVNGKYIAVIPKIGIPIMMTKKQSDIPEGVVDYGKKEETK